MKSRARAFRVTPADGSSMQRTTSKLFCALTLRSSRSNMTSITTLSEEDVIVDNDFGVEVCATRDAATLHELGMHEYQMQRYEEAIDSWNQALLHTPEDEAKIYFYLLKVHLELQDFEEAKRFLESLRKHLPKMSFPEPCPLVLDYLVQHEEWHGAARLAASCKVDSQLLARIHYQMGISETATTAQRMDGMNNCLACRPKEPRLQLAAHAELVQLHTAAGNYLQALEHHEERLALLQNKSDIAKAFYEEAELYISLGHKEKAMLALEKGLELYPCSMTLLEAKADLYFLLGNVEESLTLHEQILDQTKEDPLEQTKLLYTMGRIAHKSGMRERAVAFYQRELALTQQHWGKMHLECSRIYHELARLADEACDYDLALEYLHKALHVETKHDDAQVQLLIRQTQKLIGKIHYKMGDFERAASFVEL